MSQVQAIFPQYDAAGRPRWLCGADCAGVVQALRPADVLPALAEVQRAVDRGLYAAGYIAYEAEKGTFYFSAVDHGANTQSSDKSPRSGPIQIKGAEKLSVPFSGPAMCGDHKRAHSDFPAGCENLDDVSGSVWSRRQASSDSGKSECPLLWFGLFKEMAVCDRPPLAAGGEFALGEWQPSVSQDEYRRAIGRVKAYIAAGDTYQVNYTFRLRTTFRGQPWPLFARLCRAQQSQYAAYIQADDFAICSASPELFFDLSDGVITAKPMKGTAPRGATAAEDRRLRAALAESVKNRAENAMIVDMMRNDLGRIAEVGSVAVSDVFAVEQYPTLFQMTSTVSARTRAPLVEIIRALFPCASITGAPKVRTMQIIRELEPDARGVYCGCIGYVAPGGRARFNVAIRTAVIGTRTGTAEYGTGGGIVWDSQTDDEYAEALTKAAVLSRARETTNDTNKDE